VGSDDDCLRIIPETAILVEALPACHHGIRLPDYHRVFVRGFVQHPLFQCGIQSIITLSAGVEI
jgi:hypothetical protein